ncbi:MAG: 4'-phosphopantetheinyl transferase superfamily protein [Bacteroidales bacterium]|nr:4'-phosphopantetheinyl transferase superfamily protein [Bacteroidales bacterium]
MPIIQQENLPNGIMWAIWRVDESIDELIQLSKKPDERKAAITQFPHERRKLEYLATRLIIEHLSHTTADIEYLPNGKPFLADHSYQISLSHTIGFAAAILHPNETIGIDIEAILPRILKIKEKFLSEQELNHTDSNQEIVHLLLQWSAKESVFKAMGEEEVDFKTQLHIESFIPQTSGIFNLKESRTTLQKNYSISYLVAENFVMTWAM